MVIMVICLFLIFEFKPFGLIQYLNNKNVIVD